MIHRLEFSENEQTKLDERTQQLFDEHQHQFHSQTDRLFLLLMALQWLGCIIIAITVSPRTWIGTHSLVHIHVWAAIMLGGLISVAPLVMATRYPGTAATRHVVAFSQALWTCLLIHLTGGRLETHFHAFGSLAFLAFYRDWKVLVTASLVLAIDHALRGTLWPESVYGVSIQSPFRFFEHTAWLGFIDIFLAISCLRSDKESRQICSRRAALELTNEKIEERVQRRTHQLENATSRLQDEFENHRKTQKKSERLYGELVVASRRAGMAEVATGVLHNVGNVLNSINVSANVLGRKLSNSKVDRLSEASQIIRQNEETLESFLVDDERGKQFPKLLEHLSSKLCRERNEMRDELQSLNDNLEHIKHIVSMQQDFARLGATKERASIEDLVEDAIGINEAALQRHDVQIVREFAELPSIITDKHKVLQILVNLIVNAKQALTECEIEQKTIRISTAICELDKTLQVKVSDNGPGIANENLTRVFNHGFTTKKEGHGFGLHSSAIAAGELGGCLTVQSRGPRQGATFTLALPIKKGATCLI